jgi:Maltose acetyltransferase hexapeptide capping motif
MTPDAGGGDTRSQRERMLAGDPYIAADPVLAEESRRAALLTKELNESSPSEPAVRRRILVDLLGSFGGVTIGADTVVGAGAVVTRDLPEGVLAVGNPARIVRALG